MKYIKEESDSSNIKVKKNKAKTQWKEKVNDALIRLVKKFKGCRINLNEVAKRLQKLFDDDHHFTAKSCKDRYNHYLKEGLNFLDLTDKEIKTLIQLIKINGNQWSIIAKQMQNRSEQFIKNKFYALVKKVLRILYKIAFKNRNSMFQFKQGSYFTNNIKPHIITKYLCGNKEDDQINSQEKSIRSLAQDLVFNNIKITKQSELSKVDCDKLLLIFDFMKKQNDKYLKEYKRATNRKVQTQYYFSICQINQLPQKNTYVSTSIYFNNTSYQPLYSEDMPSLSYMQK